MEVVAGAAQKVQVIGDVLIFIKGVFCQKDRQLGLDAKARAKGFFQKIPVSQGGFCMVVKKQQVQGETVGGREFGCGKGF